MEILTVLRARLIAANVNPVGGWHINSVPQNQPRPNGLLLLEEDSDDWTHQGPDGLQDAHVVLHARADSVPDAAALGKQVVTALNDWYGTQFGLNVQFLQHFKTRAEYSDGARVHAQIMEFRAVYRRVA